MLLVEVTVDALIEEDTTVLVVVVAVGLALVELLNMVDEEPTVGGDACVDVMPRLLSQTLDGGTLRALLFTFGSICKISTSGSLMRAVIKTCACLVASKAPLIVIDRSH